MSQLDFEKFCFNRFASLVSFANAGTDLIATTVQAALVELANRNFGKNQGFVQEPLLVSTPSEIFVSVAHLEITLPVDATIRVGWSSLMGTSKSNTLGEVRMVIDSGLPGEIVVQAGLSTQTPLIFSGFDQGALLTGLHTFDLEMQRISGNGNVEAEASRIEFWRIT